MIILAIDPGSALSALVFFDTVGQCVVEKMKIGNEAALLYLEHNRGTADHLAIEMAESFGAKVWGQVFTTVLWTGRLVQAWRKDFTLVTRREVKMQLCNSGRAKDAQIRNCLIERWGGKDVAIGNRKEPGPLFGITADMWQALAIGVTWSDARPHTKQRAA